MSKQSEAKKDQGWRKKPDTCAGCKHFTSDLVNVNARWPSYPPFYADKNIRCGLGGFKTGKSNTCDKFEAAA